MTNEDKARELSCVNYLTEEDELLGPPEDVKIRINSYWAAMKMAEWKEQQMIDKAVDVLEKTTHDYFDGDLEFMVADCYLTKEGFIEDFKKFMKRE